jgi:hypothetical protein
MPSSNLLDFLIRAANEPSLLDKIKQKTRDEQLQALQDDHGLSATQAKAVLDKDSRTISQEVGDELMNESMVPDEPED